MNRRVFQCHNEVASNSQFQKTVEALEEYVNKTLDYAKDLKSLCNTYETCKIDEPMDLTTEDQKSETKSSSGRPKCKHTYSALMRKRATSRTFFQRYGDNVAPQ